MPIASLTARARAALHGHRHTVAPFFATTVRPPSFPPSRRIRVPFRDPIRGDVGITARVGPEITERGVVVAIHGMGGDANSPYLATAARAAERAGLGCVRMNMRGADRGGDDVYHGGLALDVRTLLHSEELARAERVYLLGYSLGGHLALSYALELDDPRVRAVASVCAPLDFEAGVRFIDARSGAVYRHHLLRGMKQVHEAASRRDFISASVERVRKVNTIREWDHVVVAPRFGFDSAEDYYQRVSVGPRLHALRVPTLIVAANRDPMVRVEVLTRWLGEAAATVVRTDAGGHVGFPEQTDLGLGETGSIEEQVVAWLTRHA